MQCEQYMGAILARIIRVQKGAKVSSRAAKHVFGYLLSIPLKEQDHLWAAMCELKSPAKEKTECFAASVERIFPMKRASAIHADALLPQLLFQPALRMQQQRHQRRHLLHNWGREFLVPLTDGLRLKCFALPLVLLASCS